MKNIDKIYSELEKQHLISPADLLLRLEEEMNRATVYRGLKRLVEDGKAREVQGHGVTFYEVLVDDHQHVHCHGCERYIPVHVDRSLLQQAIGMDCEIEHVDIHLTGTCSECKV